MAGALNIFTKVHQEKFEMQTIAQMAADITAIVGKISNNLSLKRRELIRSTESIEPTELLFGEDLTKHVKNLIMAYKLKRNESYYQSKYSNNKCSKDHPKSKVEGV